MSDVEYGRLRWDVETWDVVTLKVEHVVCSNVMWNVMQRWCDVEWRGVDWCDMKGGVM